MKKELIKEKAIEILAEHGYFTTTTRAIAEEANISLGSIYSYYKNKEDILNTIFKEEYLKRENFLKKINTKEMNSIEKIETFLDFHFEELSNNRALTTVLSRESLNPELQTLEGIQQFTQQLPQFFEEILKQDESNRLIRNLNSELISKVIFNTIRSSVYTLSACNHCDFETMKEEIKKFIIGGIKK